MTYLNGKGPQYLATDKEVQSIPFLASQDALEVMSVTHSLTE